jgi:hypothetical protein
MIIRGGGGRRLDMDHHMGSLGLTCVREMDLVADPLHLTLCAVPGLRIIRGRDERCRGQHVLHLAPPEGAIDLHGWLSPDAAAGLYGGDLLPPGRLESHVNRLEPPLTIGPSHLPERLARGFRLWDMIVLHPMALAVIPCRGCQGLSPGRCHHREGVQRRPKRLSDTLQPIEHANRRQDRDGIRPLTAVDVEQPLRLCQGQQGIEAEWRRLPGDEPGTKCAQDGMLEAWVGQFQPQDLLPINAAADGICGLTIQAAFRKLQDRGQRQTRWRVGGLAACGEKRCERCVVVDGAEPNQLGRIIDAWCRATHHAIVLKHADVVGIEGHRKEMCELEAKGIVVRDGLHHAAHPVVDRDD